MGCGNKICTSTLAWRRIKQREELNLATKEKVSGSDLKGLLDAALEIGRKRNAVLQRMRSALERNDNVEALRLGKELCGLEDKKTSNRTDPGIN